MEPSEDSYPTAYPSVIKIGTVDASGGHLVISNNATSASAPIVNFSLTLGTLYMRRKADCEAFLRIGAWFKMSLI